MWEKVQGLRSTNCPCVLYSSSYRPLSPLSPPHSPLAVVTMFLISVSLVIFCLLFSFVDYVPVKGEIIWYLSLTAWLIALSILLCSPTHAMTGVCRRRGAQGGTRRSGMLPQAKKRPPAPAAGRSALPKGAALSTP